MQPRPWTLALMVALFALSTAQAQPKPDAKNERPPQGQQGGEGGGHRRPPPEALEACKSLKSNAACSFQHPERGTIKGSCFAPEGKPLACRPADAPKGEPPR